MSQPSIPICITLGTRPEAIELAPVNKQFQQSPQFQTQIVLTGQHKEMVAQVMELFNLKADLHLEIMQPRQTLTDIACRSLQGLDELFGKWKPRIVLVPGDTSTAFAAALAAFYQKIPVGHVEAGLRTNDLFNPYPEEANRRLIFKLPNCTLPIEQAVKNLAASGVVGEVPKTGNTVIDALLTVTTNPKCQVPGLDWDSSVILATVHRRENWDKLEDIAQGFLQIFTSVS